MPTPTTPPSQTTPPTPASTPPPASIVSIRPGTFDSAASGGSAQGRLRAGGTGARGPGALPYVPARWLRGGHAHTVFANFSRPLPRPRARRERWDLPDGDFLDVDRYPGVSPDVPLLVVCHGLEGSSRAPYVRGLVAIARRRGLAAAALNFRLCQGTQVP